jgi:hypothetical protein
MVLLTMLALAILASLAFFDALQSWRAALLAEDALEARARAHGALREVFAPPSVPWLCLQPPHHQIDVSVDLPAGGRARVAWRTLHPADVQAEVTGFGDRGARHRLLVRLTPDSVPGAVWLPGCPAATRLHPAGPDWWRRHPEG